MQHADAPLGQHAADQQTAMALGGVLFAAEDCEARGRRVADKPVQSGLESLAAGDPVVEDVALAVVELRAVGPAAQRVAEKVVSYRLHA